MIHRGALQMAGATAANTEKFRCSCVALPGTANTSETFFQGSGDGAGHAFASFFGESLGEFVG